MSGIAPYVRLKQLAVSNGKYNLTTNRRWEDRGPVVSDSTTLTSPASC